MKQFDMQVLNYESPILEERFDQLIAEKMVEQEKRIETHVVYTPGSIGEIKLQCGAEYKGLVGDCFIVENREQGTFKVVDFQDADASPAVQLSESPYFRGALYTMFHQPRIDRLFGEKAHLIVPGWFLDQYPLLTRRFRGIIRERRQHPRNPRLLFRGTILNHNGVGRPAYAWNSKPFRQTAVVLQEKYPDEVDISDQKLPREEWFLKAGSHVMVLTLPGHPWCYREFELLNLGIPLVAYPWHHHVDAGALPISDVHYIATADLRREEPGFAVDPEEGADRIIDAFRAARAFSSWVERVGQAGQRWYDRALSPEVISAGVLAFLNLNGSEWHADVTVAGPLPRPNPMEAV